MSSSEQFSRSWRLDSRTMSRLVLLAILLIIMGVTARLALLHFDRTTNLLNQAHLISDHLHNLQTLLAGAESGLSNDASACAAAAAGVQDELQLLEQMFQDQPEQQQRVQSLAALLPARLALLQQVRQARQASKTVEVQQLLHRAARQQPLTSIHAVLQQVQQTEDAFLTERLSQAQITTGWLILTLTGSSLLALAVTAGAARSLGQGRSRQQRIEAALGDSERRYRLLFEQARDAILITDAQTRVLDANPQAEVVLGHARRDLLGLRLLELLAPARPEQGPDELHQQLRQQHSWQAEFLLSRPDGLQLPVELSVQRSSAGHLQILLRDITARKQAEEALRRSHNDLEIQVQSSAEALAAEAAARQAADDILRAVVQAVPLALIVLDPECQVRIWNPAAEQLFGWTGRESVRQPCPLISSERPEEYQTLLARVLRGESILDMETQQQRKDGSWVSVSLSAAPLRRKGGEGIGAILVCTDIAERKRLEDQLRQAQKMEAVGRLAGGIAHDFNNLLTVINGYTALLLHQFATDSTAQWPLEEIKKAGERAAGLTRQLLAFSRKQLLQPKELHLNTVVTGIEKMLRRILGEDITFITALAPDLGCIKADPGQIEQILLNLVVNARDAMPQGGRLTIKTRNVELDTGYAQTHLEVPPGAYVLLSVSDTGVGMTAEVKRHLFEPFFTTKATGQGTGLGLATVYGIVKQSGGTIGVYSEVGLGTTCKVYLPRVQSADPLPTPTPGLPPALPHGSETILLAEDEESVRALTRQLLQNLGYTVLEAADGTEALRIAAEYTGPIHLLLTDVVMPRLSGRSLAQQLTAVRPGIQVLYMSGYTDTAMLRHGVLEEDMSFLHKPFRPAELAGMVREVLEKASSPL